MRKLLPVILAITLACFAPEAAFARQVTGAPSTPDVVVANQVRNDGEIVSIAGEAIGEALRADDGRVWVNVLGDTLALGVVLDRDAAKAIETYGDYTHRGDRIVATGLFHISCAEHRGETDLHATEFVIVEHGGRLDHPVPWTRVGIGLTGLAFAGMLGLRYRAREHEAPSGH